MVAYYQNEYNVNFNVSFEMFPYSMIFFYYVVQLNVQLGNNTQICEFHWSKSNNNLEYYNLL